MAQCLAESRRRGRVIVTCDAMTRGASKNLAGLKPQAVAGVRKKKCRWELAPCSRLNMETEAQD